ncbi:hypothetical protein HFP51_02415 [Parasphingopyxis sp. CP4]|uniref:hypothetical protein n=1 Tax=Parasphingopyxis sp. CP4 TaxID=2724527 RepID=UPI0015A43A9E|nr:hypothetical protein [Parasphingopyxis sp. CP4]QLC21137.1 hypothetical protein HFP51_02415 [Parasphingopyxis sp. CP4]
MPKSATIFSGIPAQLLIATIVVGVGMAAVSLLEYTAFDWHPAREEPAGFTPYHFGRMAVSALLAIILVAACAKPWLAEQLPARKKLWPAEMRNGIVVAAIAAAAVAILAWNPNLFHWFAREDNVLEWLSALFILIGALFFLYAAARSSRQGVSGPGKFFSTLLIPIGFAGLFFLIGMEEISWGQRLLGFETPESLAERNWQQEFNFHNIHTDLFELAYYLGTGAFLIILPLAAPPLRSWPAFDFFADFVPNRSVAMLTAPGVIFSYGHWNLVPLQFLTFATLFAMLIFAVSAKRDGRTGEYRLFGAVAALIAIGQLIVLLYGPQMLDVPDATEFRELFISIGLFAFAAYYAFDVAAPDTGKSKAKPD